MSEEKLYVIPEKHLFRLLEICSKQNKCKTFGSASCQCSNPDFVKATPKQRNKKARK